MISLARSLFCLMASMINGPEVRIRRSDSLIALGSCSPTSELLGTLGGGMIGLSRAGLVSGEGGGVGDDGLLSLPGFFMVDLEENSTLSGVDEDEIAA
jgi:hypothetical protein